jgi:membrane-anchored protein YejM (alkaline phosphatase superfamily)
MGIPHFVDVNTINFRNAFDEVNGEKNSSSVFIETASSVGYNDAAYFITTITNRILERLGHIFFIKDMDDPFAIVSGENYMSDSSILEELRTTLIETQQSNQPLFAHIHLVSTHGPTFDPKVEKFSAGETQDEEWMIDFYDDAILTFDQNLQAFVEFLENKELFDNTILVIYSDHGYQWSATDKIPLIIHFPQDLNAGTVSENTQNLDISSTILDYMGIEQPTWMGGSTLLGELRQDRILFSAGMKSSIASNGQIVEQIITPPFYQFGRLYVIKCQMLYEIDLQNLAMGTLHIDHYIDPCSENMLASEMEIWSEAGQMLSDLGYELPAEWPK